jgi:peptidoglycan/xylan/chitin deacetylase (PgdA/CDA1 family)
MFRQAEDPWNCRLSAYEQAKYAQTLELLGAETPARALELGCAEGVFTRMLAPRVGELLATDISRVALDRARARCGSPKVAFRKLDFVRDALGGPYDLVVCSEALYYAGSRRALRAVLKKIFQALAPGGLFLTANANQVADEPAHAGFDWGADFGSRTIRDAALACGFRLAHEIETPLYRIQAFRRGGGGAPVREARPIAAELEPRVAASALWAGGASRAKALHEELTARVPILMYHRVASEGPVALARYRVTPERFAEHVELIRRAGFYSIGTAELLSARARRKPLPGRPILITFDDGYVDFERHAWPVLRRREFGAVLFVVTDKVGGAADWDAGYGAPAPLLDWPALRRLQAEGVEIGSHGASHRELTALATRDIYREALRSRHAIAAELGREPDAISYPHGAFDDVVAGVAADCGYRLGFSYWDAVADLSHDPFGLPRIEVTAEDDADVLAAKLGVGG